MVYLYQQRSVILQVLQWRNVSVPTLYDAIKQSLPTYADLIEGMRLLSYRESRFLITFDKNSDSDLASVYRDVFHSTCENGFDIETPQKQQAKIYSQLPQQPDEIVTLYPCPFEMEDGHFKQIVTNNNWGTLKKITYGKIRNLGRIKNGYVNLHMIEPNYHNMDSQVKAFGHVIGVTKPYEAHLPLCNYCKTRGHSIQACPKIQKKKCIHCSQTGHDVMSCPNTDRPGTTNQTSAWKTVSSRKKTSNENNNSKPRITTQNRFDDLKNVEEKEDSQPKDETSDSDRDSSSEENIDNDTEPAKALSFSEFVQNIKTKKKKNKAKRRKKNQIISSSPKQHEDQSQNKNNIKSDKQTEQDENSQGNLSVATDVINYMISEALNNTSYSITDPEDSTQKKPTTTELMPNNENQTNQPIPRTGSKRKINLSSDTANSSITGTSTSNENS